MKVLLAGSGMALIRSARSVGESPMATARRCSVVSEAPGFAARRLAMSERMADVSIRRSFALAALWIGFRNGGDEVDKDRIAEFRGLDGKDVVFRCREILVAELEACEGGVDGITRGKVGGIGELNEPAAEGFCLAEAGVGETDLGSNAQECLGIGEAGFF